MEELRDEAAERQTYGVTLKELRTDVRARARCVPVAFAFHTLFNTWLAATQYGMAFHDIRVVVSRALIIIGEARGILAKLVEEGEEVVLPRPAFEPDEEFERLANGGYTYEELKTKLYGEYVWNDPLSLLNLANNILIEVEAVIDEVCVDEPTEENLEQPLGLIHHAATALEDAAYILFPDWHRYFNSDMEE